MSENPLEPMGQVLLGWWRRNADADEARIRRAVREAAHMVDLIVDEEGTVAVEDTEDGPSLVLDGWKFGRIQ